MDNKSLAYYGLQIMSHLTKNIRTLKLHSSISFLVVCAIVGINFTFTYEIDVQICCSFCFEKLSFKFL